MHNITLSIFIVKLLLGVRLVTGVMFSFSNGTCKLDESTTRLRKRSMTSNSVVAFDAQQNTMKWNSKNITYKISAYTDQLDKDFIDTEIDKAFRLWSEHVDIEFLKIFGNDSEVDIEIKFCRGDHGDSAPFRYFDIAHAFPPDVYLGGDIHLNDNYTNWHEGTTLLHTVTHEIGHAIGLNHSPLRFAVMSPYQGHPEFPVNLASEDIEMAQALYGKKPPKVTKPTFPPINMDALAERLRSAVTTIKTTMPPTVFVETDPFEKWSTSQTFPENSMTTESFTAVVVLTDRSVDVPTSTLFDMEDLVNMNDHAANVQDGSGQNQLQDFEMYDEEGTNESILIEGAENPTDTDFEIDLPEGNYVETGFSPNNLSVEASSGATVLVFRMSLFLIIILLMTQAQSYKHAILTLSALTFYLTGVLLWPFRFTFNPNILLTLNM